jgi:hypothetical protein
MAQNIFVGMDTSLILQCGTKPKYSPRQKKNVGKNVVAYPAGALTKEKVLLYRTP